MKKISINVPENISYLSEWDSLWDMLPKGEHFILDKKVCGCGATEAYLRSSQKVILAAPRKLLLHNKYKQHLSDKFHLFRYNGDDSKYFSTASGGSPVEAISSLEDYISGKGEKILVTYDSLKYVYQVLLGKGENLNDWTLVIDEFQIIFYDCMFKATTELDFSLVINKFSNVVYVSATPMMDKYLDKTQQFKNLNIYELVWGESRIIKPYIEVKHCKYSLKKACEAKIDEYRNGAGQTVKLPNGTIFTSTEAVFFLNNVKEIMNIIRSKNMKPEEVNIIISKNKANDAEISALNKSMGLSRSHYHKIGVIPGKGEHHKRFTFCTSTVYVGADFYSKCASTYIFANPDISSMAIDISIDLQQIIGRQRLSENPFRNTATLYFNTTNSIDEEEFLNSIKKKNQITSNHLENFEAAPNKDLYLDILIRLNNFTEHYCNVSEVINGVTTERRLVKNDLMEISDIRAWEIHSHIYVSDLSMYCALAAEDIGTQLNNSIPKDILQEWNKDGNFSRKAKLYCELEKDGRLESCIFIEKDFHDCFDALGEEGMEKLSWDSGRIHNAITPIKLSDAPNAWNICQGLISRFAEGKTYPKSKVKEYLDGVYKSFDIPGTPKASDIEEYIYVKKTTTRDKDQKSINSYRILSHSRKKVSLFNRLANVTKPNNSYDVDGILDLIKKGEYFDLIKTTEDVRKSTDKKDKDYKKSLLPMVCWNGTFKCRNKNNGENYSSFVALDFDNVSDMEAMKRWLEAKACVYAYFVTPSGNGLKAIILHDNCLPTHHNSLYKDLLKEFDCPEIDKSTVDFARGHYLCYDPDLWINTAPVAYHYDYTNGVAEFPEGLSETVIKTGTGLTDRREEVIVDGFDVSRFLDELNRVNKTDETIIRYFSNLWTGSTITESGRNNAAMSYLGILCKAGVDKSKARSFVETLIPGFDLEEITEYAYTHNTFGSSRRRPGSRG